MVTLSFWKEMFIFKKDKDKAKKPPKNGAKTKTLSKITEIKFSWRKILIKSCFRWCPQRQRCGNPETSRRRTHVQWKEKGEVSKYQSTAISQICTFFFVKSAPFFSCPKVVKSAPFFSLMLKRYFVLKFP